MPRNYVVIGSGPAGVAGAVAVRELDPRGNILLFGAERLSFYSRIRLPEYLDGRIERERLVIRGEAWFREREIDLRLGTRVEGLDVKEARVRLGDGSSHPYDACLLATGANPFLPPLPGRDLPGVLTMRTVEDAETLQDLASQAGRLVTIGGGVLGLEMSASLVNMGRKVLVLHNYTWLLNRQLDPEGGKVVQELLERRGLEFRLGAKVEGIEGRDRATDVRLDGGETIPTSGVLVSTGIAPEVTLAREAGITVNRGIAIDDSTATSASNVYAAGDCAEHEGRVHGIWPAADAQGRVAGTVMAGGEAEYSGTVPSHKLKVTGIDVFSIGKIDSEGKFRNEITRGEGVYRKLVRDETGRLIGAILVGDLSGSRKITADVQKGGMG